MTKTMATLLVLYVLLVTLATLGATYLLVSFRLRMLASSNSKLALNESALLEKIRHHVSTVTWWVMVAVTAISLVAVLLGIRSYVLAVRQRERTSEAFALQTITQQIQPLRVTPDLVLDAWDDHTLSNSWPKANEPFTVTASLANMSNPRKLKACTRFFTTDLLPRTKIHIRATQFSVSEPSIDSGRYWWERAVAEGRAGLTYTNVPGCGIEFSWVVSTPVEGPLTVLVSLAYKNGSASVYKTKRLSFAVGFGREQRDVTTSVTSIIVALITLVGVLLTAWLNARKSGAVAPENREVI